MRASNEVTIDRKEFLEAVARIPRGGLRTHSQHSPRKTLIYADPPLLIVETPYVRSEILATGTWQQPVAVFARLLVKVARSLPKTERITLLYAAGRLYFDRLSVEAMPAPGMIPAKDGRLGALPGTAARKPTQGAPATGEEGQLLMPGLAPVTDRERLEHHARAPMRPRRRL
jgi:hypothetical protein